MTVGQLRKVFDDCYFMVYKDDNEKLTTLLNEYKKQWVEDNPIVAQMEVDFCSCGEWMDENGFLHSVVWVRVQ